MNIGWLMFCIHLINKSVLHQVSLKLLKPSKAERVERCRTSERAYKRCKVNERVNEWPIFHCAVSDRSILPCDRQKASHTPHTHTHAKITYYRPDRWTNKYTSILLMNLATVTSSHSSLNLCRILKMMSVSGSSRKELLTETNPVFLRQFV